MAETVAIVSVVVSGFITPGVVGGYTLRQQRQQQGQARRDELRDTIDAAAKQAGAALRRIEDVHEAWRQDDVDPASKDKGAWFAEANVLREETRWARDRLRIRVIDNDPTDLVALYQSLLNAITSYRQTLEGMDTKDLFEAHRQSADDAWGEVQKARESFLRAAFQRVGVASRQPFPSGRPSRWKRR